MTITQKEMRRHRGEEKGADNTCPVTTGIFLRIAIKEALRVFKRNESPLPFWRVADEKHPVLKKLGITASDIIHLRHKESL